MKPSTLILAIALTSSAALAQERPPLILKAIELGVANSVVVRKCKGWSLNPAISAQLLVAIGLAGLTDQFERIEETEIARIAESSIAEHWQAERVAEQCAAVAKMTMPNPVKPDETLQLFVQAQ